MSQAFCSCAPTSPCIPYVLSEACFPAYYNPPTQFSQLGSSPVLDTCGAEFKFLISPFRCCKPPASCLDVLVSRRHLLTISLVAWSKQGPERSQQVKNVLSSCPAVVGQEAKLIMTLQIVETMAVGTGLFLLSTTFPAPCLGCSRSLGNSCCMEDAFTMFSQL